MYVIKRDGSNQLVSFDKIINRLKPLCDGLHLSVDPVEISQQVVGGLYSGVQTSVLDDLASETAAARISQHPDYGVLAARIFATNLHKNTTDTFSENIKKMANYYNPETGEHAPLISYEIASFVSKHAGDLNSIPDYQRDLEYDFFGLKTLYRSYLLRMNGKVAERPQQMLLRVAIVIGGKDINRISQVYEQLSLRLYTDATPTLFNAGTPRQQMSSCFLMTMKKDSIDGIFDTIKDCAVISKYAGGIGISVTDIRASGSYIRGTNGNSNGIIPMLRVLNNVARYVDQGGGKRKGSFAVYIEPWHADIREFIELKKNQGYEQDRARDLFYALWIPDLFMKRVQANGSWTLFCPLKAPGLTTSHSEDFETLYTKYESEGRGSTTVDARELFQQIVASQIETGVPYMLYKDACNSKSNQQNLGTIKCSNLCTEIVQYTSPEEISVCNLASINLSKFTLDVCNGDTATSNHVNYTGLIKLAYDVATNLNHLIDINYYPVSEARESNMRHRPIGIGVQGLADVFCMLDIPFDCDTARKINSRIFESIYYGAVQASIDQAKLYGPYESFDGSPASNGRLQFHLWGLDQQALFHDWDNILAALQRYGMRNSLLVAPMPTASTSQILGNNECFEPYTSNIFTRRTLSGEFTIVNKHLMQKLIHLGLWDKTMRNAIIAEQGSIQNIASIPDHVKQVYRTVWEIPMKSIIDMAADRAPFICQSQSLNAYMSNATLNKVSSMHMYAWSRGLKTGMYYLRTQAKAKAVQFTVDRVSANILTSSSCATDNEEDICQSCSA